MKVVKGSTKNLENKLIKKETEKETTTLPPMQITLNQTTEEVLCDTSSHKPLEGIEKGNKFFELLENIEGEKSLDGKSFKISRESELQIWDKQYDFNTNIQQAASNRSLVLISLSNDVTTTFNGIPRTVAFTNYKPIEGAAKSGRFQSNKQTLSRRVSDIEAGIGDESDDF